MMVNAMITLGSDDGLWNVGQCDDIIVTAIVTLVGVMITIGHMVNVIIWSV